MAKADIGPKIGIEGEAQFRKELNEINQGLKVLDSEAKAVAASMQDETDAEKKSAAQKDVLERKILSQSEKLDKLKQGLEASARKYGEADTRTQKWQKAVYDATADLANMEHELKGVDGAVDEAADSMREAERATGSWADVMKGSLLADAVKAGLSKVVELSKEAASALWNASTSGAAYADEIITLSVTSGLATDTLQEFQYLEGLADVSTGTLTGSITKLKKQMATAKEQQEDYNQKMAEAAQETDEEKRAAMEAKIELGAAAANMKELGVEFTDANGDLRDSEDVFFDLIDALGKIENDTERDAAAMALMGKSATELNPIILAGSDALKDMRKQAHDAGAVLSGTSLRALGKQQDAMDRLGKRVEAVSNQFAVKLAPGVTKGAEALNKAFENPRVERGINVVSEGIGNLISGAMDLAANALPKLFEVFAFGDERLRLYNDTQLELVNRLEAQKEAHEQSMAAYRENAGTIVEETKRTESLWRELQTLAGKNGEVREADRERVDYILNELNDALGTEYELNGNIIGQYQDMQKEIRELIKQREAEALLETGKDAYVNARSSRIEAVQEAADLYQQQLEAQEKYNAAAKASDEWWAENKEAFVNATLFKRKRLEAEAQEVDQAAVRALTRLQMLQKDYEAASESADEYMSTIDRYEKAQTAAIQGNYAEAVRLMADELGVTIDYYRQKAELNEKDRKDLQEKLSAQERYIEEYKRKLEDGVTGWSEEGLKEAEDYAEEIRNLLDGKSVGKAYADGIISGMDSKKSEIYTAAIRMAEQISNATRRTLQIASPSKVARYMTSMWDEGLLVGLEAGKDKLERASRSLSESIIAGADSLSPTLGTYNYAAAAPIGSYGGGTRSYTTNLGGINITIPNAAGLNEELLAHEIAVQLTHELQAAQRGGRL